MDAVHAMYETNSVPAWLIADQTYRNRYIFAGLGPRQPFPGRWYKSGAVRRAPTLDALADEIDVPPDALRDTVSRFNGFAESGVDTDFHRGDSAYDRYYGDPRNRPNPNLAPLAEGAVLRDPDRAGRPRHQGRAAHGHRGTGAARGRLGDRRPVRGGQRERAGDGPHVRGTGRDARPGNGVRVPGGTRHGGSEAMTSGFRTIDVGAPRTRFARGWHCLGLAEPFRDGKPHAIEAFGTKLVVFATEDGTLNVLDAYCRHMGGDLSQGTVKGEAIACPFHDWRWAGNGKCVQIPYAKRIPLRARTRSWLTLERNEQLFVWHDPEGNPPPDDIVIPETKGASGPEWSDWTWDTVRIDGSNCREIIDNMVDMAHFFYIHFAFPTYFKNVFEGHIATQYLNSRGRPDVDARVATRPTT